MSKYHISPSRVIRHWDVTGKSCPNGYLGKDEWAKLHEKLTGSDNVYGSNENVPAYPTRNISRGSTGLQVKAFQKCMNKLINAKLSVDGVYGKASIKACKKYQKKKKLTCDGICGPKTRESIQSDIVKKGYK